MNVTTKIAILVLVMVCAALQAEGQSKELKAMAEITWKQAMKKNGFSIVYEGFADINSYRPMSSRSISFSERKQYAVVALVEKRSSVTITVTIGGQQINPPCDYNTSGEISVVLTKFNEAEGKGTISASINDPLWHKGFLIIGVK